jgi:hypothetical protein
VLAGQFSLFELLYSPKFQSATVCMKKAFFFALAFNSFLVFAQDIETSKDITYSFSEPFEGTSMHMGYPLGYKASFTNNGEIYSFLLESGKYKFLKNTGPFLNETFRTEVPKDKKADIEGVEKLGDRYYFFFSRWAKSKKSEQLFVRELDFEKGDFLGPEKQLYASYGKLNDVASPVIAWMAPPKFKRIKSMDDSKLLVAYTWQMKSKNEKTKNQQIGMHVFDASMTELWQRVIEIPYVSDHCMIMDYTIDRLNNAHILVQIFQDKSDARKDKTGSHLIVFRVNATTGEVTGTDISIEAVVVREAKLSENENGQIIAYGLYGESSLELTDGVFATTINENGGILLTRKVDIPNSVIAQHSSERLQQKIERTEAISNWGLNNLVLKDVVLENNGSLTLYAEGLSVGNYINTSSTMGTGERSNIRYGDILVARIEPDSSLTRLNIIPKKQMASIQGAYDRRFLKETSFGELGFVLMNKHRNPYVIFVDNIKNFNLPENEAPQSHRNGFGGFLTGYKIDQQTGAMENITFFDLKNAKGKVLKQFSIEKVFQLSENEIAIEFATHVARQNVMVKVNLPD